MSERAFATCPSDWAGTTTSSRRNCNRISYNSLGDGQERPSSWLYSKISDEFHLTPQERAELLPSKRQPILNNRVAWALFHMKSACLVESPKRGIYKLTTRGQQVLKKHANKVDMRVLVQFAEYAAMKEKQKPQADGNATLAAVPLDEQIVTPDEAISAAYGELRASLAQELLEKIKQSSPQFFEQLVVDVLLAMGYGGSGRDAGEALGKTGDGGLDGVIREDKLGLDVIYIQAKRWEGVVGRPVVQGFVGAIHGARASKGVIITTSDFSAEAREYVKTIPTRIVLVDGRTLAELMIDHNVAVSRVSNYEIKKVDNDYFSEL